MNNTLYQYFFQTIILLNSTFGFCQFTTSKLINENSVAKGTFKDDSLVYNIMEKYCHETKLNDKEIKKDTEVIISDLKYCKKGYSDYPYEYFEIIYNNKIFYVEKEKIITEESYSNEISTMSDEFRLKFRENAIKIGDSVFQKKLNEVKSFINSCSTKGLVILDWSFYDESEYTQGTGIKISIINPTKKNIKYIWFTFSGYNAVDDLIFDRIKGKSKITIKGIGPLNSGASGKYEYNYVWHSDLVQNVKINQIKVQFMDETFKTILVPTQITLTKNLLELIE